MAAPLIVLVEPDHAEHDHADLLAREGFRVSSVSMTYADVAGLAAGRPALVAAELLVAHAARTLDFAARFRANPSGRMIPFIVYGHHLRAADIEHAARVGVLWLQLEPGDGAKLAAAVRGVLAAAEEPAASAT